MRPRLRAQRGPRGPRAPGHHERLRLRRPELRRRLRRGGLISGRERAAGERVTEGRRPLDRKILALALPALGALIAEPLFLLTDTALVGHLGDAPLAGLAIASTILQTVVGLLIFLAYATTPAVARRLGAGDRRGAIRAGIDGLWLALLIGGLLLVVGLPLAGPAVAAFGAEPAVADAATTYLGISLFGVPAMLLVIAATGLLRGLQDTRTPLVVATAGFAVNAGLNAVFIYGFGLGVAGSAVGTVVAQWAMAAVYLVIAVRAARSSGAPLRPGLKGVGSAAATGGWLLVRTAMLRIGILATIYVGTTFGVPQLAALQIVMTIFSTIALALDALAIAGQALVGHGLGAGDVAEVVAVTRRLKTWGALCGAGLGLLLCAAAPFAGYLFSSEPQVRDFVRIVLWTMAIGIPLAGYVFVIDGILIGAGDSRYLAVAGIIAVAAYLPMLFGVYALAGDTGSGAGAWSLAWLWVVFGWGYMGARAATLAWRSRGTAWIVTGSVR